MRRIVILLVAFLFALSYVDAQVIYPDEPDTTKENQNTEFNQKSDILYQHDGTKMYVDVKKIYLNDLYYSLPGETKVNKIDQRLIYKIEYKTGKTEILNENPPNNREVGDYRKVKVTENPNEVDGMIEVAKLEAVSEGSDRGFSTPKSLERTAIIVLRRKAALVNAEIVLITDKKTSVAFGETPSVTLYGTAYSTH